MTGERKHFGAWWFVFEDKARREEEFQRLYEGQRMAIDSWARLQAAQANNLSDPIAGQRQMAERPCPCCGRIHPGPYFPGLLGGLFGRLF